MLTLLLLLTSVWKVDGNLSAECSESALKICSFDRSTPSMINKLHLPEFCFTPEKKLENDDEDYLQPMMREPGLFLNVLCKEDSCSYGGHSALAGMNTDEFKKHIHEGAPVRFYSYIGSPPNQMNPKLGFTQE